MVVHRLHTAPSVSSTLTITTIYNISARSSIGLEHLATNQEVRDSNSLGRSNFIGVCKMSGKGSKQRPKDAVINNEDNTDTGKNEYSDILTTEQSLTEVVRFNEDNNLYEVDQLPKNLINE